MAYEDYIPGPNQRGPAPGQELAGAISGLGKLFGLDPEQAARVRAHNTTIQRDAEKEKRVKRYGELMSKYAMGGGKGLTPEEVSEATDHRVWLTQGGIGATETEHLTGMTHDPKTGYSKAYSEKMRIEKEKKDAKAAADEDAKARKALIEAQRLAAADTSAAMKEANKGNAAAKERYEYLTNAKNFGATFYDQSARDFAANTSLTDGLSALDYSRAALPADASGVVRSVAQQTEVLKAALAAASDGGREPAANDPKHLDYQKAKAALLQHQAAYPAFKLTDAYKADLEANGYDTDIEALKVHFKDERAINQAIKAVALQIRKSHSISSADATYLATKIVAKQLSRGASQDEMAVDGDEADVAKNLAAGAYKLGGKVPKRVVIREAYRMANGDINYRYRIVDTATIAQPAK